MKNELSKMIAAYSGMAATAIFVAQQSNAQIIYTDPPDIHLNGYGSSATIDLNNDGVFDFGFSINDPHSTVANGTIKMTYNHNEDGTFQVRGRVDNCASSGYYNAITVFRSDRVVKDVEGHWMVPVYTGDLLDLEQYPLPFCRTWAGLKNHYVGVRFYPITQDTSSNFYYGWIRLSVKGDGTKMLIKDWAYSTVLNEKITTGQTQKVSELNSSTDLPWQIYSYGKQIFIKQNSQNLPLEISIYNLLGEEVKHITSADENLNILADQFPSGIYIVKVRSNGENISKEVVIE